MSRSIIVGDKLIIKHNAGFFSNCSVILSEISKYHILKNKLPTLVTDQTFKLYKDKNIDVDIFNNFFKLYKDIDVDIFNNFNVSEFKTSNQFNDYTCIEYEYVNKLTNLYFSPTKEVLDIKNYLIQKYKIDLKNTISIYYRGNDKISETNIPRYEEMLHKIDQVVSLNPNKKLLLQTDEIDFYEYVKNSYPNIISIEENKMIKKSNHTGVHFTLKPGEKTKKAQILLSTVLILSESSSLITNSGNVAMWICLYRGNNENVYQYLNPKNGFNPYNISSDNLWIEKK